MAFDSAADAPKTAAEQRARASAPNRSMALLLAGIAFCFLATALGVAVLVVYGPY